MQLFVNYLETIYSVYSNSQSSIVVLQNLSFVSTHSITYVLCKLKKISEHDETIKKKDCA